MRVITGSARGTRLCTPTGLQTRPTSEVAKEAVFSVLNFELSCANVLDLFAGSGQLGIEALSRGASHCDFVDSSREARLAIEQNLKATKLEDKARVSAMDAIRFLEAGSGADYDIALLDPPYGTIDWQRVLEALSPRMKDTGIVFCESEKNEQLPEKAGVLTIKKKYRYGKASMTAYCVKREEKD